MVQEYQEIPPRSQKEIIARVTLLSIHEPKEDVMVETNRLKAGLYVGRTLLPTKHRDVKVCVANTTSKLQTIPAGSCLGQVVSVSLPSDDKKDQGNRTETPNSGDPPVDIVNSTLEKLPRDLTSEQRQQVIGLLKDYDDLFSKGTYDMGRTNHIEYSIDTGSHRPIRQALHRHPRAHLDEIDRQIDELQQNDFIQPAAGPWASNVVLVKKKDGSSLRRL